MNLLILEESPININCWRIFRFSFSSSSTNFQFWQMG